MTVKQDTQAPTRARTPAISPRTTAITAMILASAAWGFGTVMSKAALESFPPVLLLVIQLLASTAALWTASLLGRVRMRVRDTRHGWPGIFEPGIAYLIGLIGVQLTTASSASLISALEPFLVLVLAVLFLRERASRTTFALLGISLIGVLLVTGVGRGEPGGMLTGDALVLLGTASAALYVVLSRRSVATVHPLPLAALQQTVGLGVALAALPFALLGGEASGLAGLTPGLIAFAALSGIVQYSLAFVLYLTALKTIPATQAALYLTLTPVFGVGGAVLFLGEMLTLAQLLGAALIVGALALMSRARAAGD